MISKFYRALSEGYYDTIQAKKVLNYDILDQIAQLIYLLKPLKVFISKCLAHTGIHGNEQADALANQARHTV